MEYFSVWGYEIVFYGEENMNLLNTRIKMATEISLEQLASVLGGNTAGMGARVAYIPEKGLLKKTPAMVKVSHPTYGDLEINLYTLGSNVQLNTQYYHSDAYMKAKIEAENARGLFANRKIEKFKELDAKEDIYCDQLNDALDASFKDLGIEIH